VSRHKRRFDDAARRSDSRHAGECPECGKLRYLTIRAAKTIRRQMHPGQQMNVYECGAYYHIGHRPTGPCFSPDTARFDTHVEAKAEAIACGAYRWTVKPCGEGHWHVLQKLPPKEIEARRLARNTPADPQTTGEN
jgi:hypothetical protein